MLLPRFTVQSYRRLLHVIGSRYIALIALAAVLLSLFSAPRAHAQGTDEHATRQPRDSATTVPIKIVGGDVLVLAEVNGHRGFYLLDIGSPEIVLNNEYLRSGGGGLDTVLAKPAGGSSTIRQADTAAIQPDWTADSVTVRIGTQTIAVTPNNAANTAPGLPLVAALTSLADPEERYGQMLGILGIAVFDRYETIIDYVHHQLTLIPLDSTGQRLVPVAQYKPSTVIPISYQIGHLTFHWYTVGTVGGRVDTLELDTGNDRNELNAATATIIPTHIKRTGRSGRMDGHDEPEGLLDSLELGGQTFKDLPFNLSPAEGREDTLGEAFFSRVGVVGFNFRTRQLLFYTI